MEGWGGGGEGGAVTESSLDPSVAQATPFIMTDRMDVGSPLLMRYVPLDRGGGGHREGGREMEGWGGVSNRIKP